MKDIIFILVMALIIYIVGRVFLKEPILPWKKKNDVPFEVNKKERNKKGKKNKTNPMDEEEPAVFRELFDSVHVIENHMIQHKDMTFSMIAEVEPVNYYLLNQDEQEGIDATFETWLAQINYSVRIYMQNRFVDLTLPIEEIQKVMEEQDDLHPMAFQFGQNMINDLKNWQIEQPRYETKTYIIFDYKVDTKDIKADDNEELKEKTLDKAFDELFRRINTAKTQLRKAGMEVHMLTTDGIGEVLYFGFNRRKARKNHYRDIENKEQMALYVTADQTASLMKRVRGEIDLVQQSTEIKNDENLETTA